MGGSTSSSWTKVLWGTSLQVSSFAGKFFEQTEDFATTSTPPPNTTTTTSSSPNIEQSQRDLLRVNSFHYNRRSQRTTGSHYSEDRNHHQTRSVRRTDKAMASAMLSARTAPSMLSRLSASTTFFSSKYASVHIRPLALPLLPRLSLPVPAISLHLPSLPSLEEIWDGLLKAVPKKKASHSRRRHRQMAGKALKDVTELCRCPACGGVKRMHFLCPTCAPSKHSRSFLGIQKDPSILMVRQNMPI